VKKCGFFQPWGSINQLSEDDNETQRFYKNNNSRWAKFGFEFIYTADHGDFVARHGMVEKCALGHNVYEDTLKVPMIMSWADNFEKGHVNNDLTELIDIFRNSFRSF